jgi:hypothetical protein
MTGWLDAMIVESKHDMNVFARIPPKMSQNLRTLMPLWNGLFDSSSSSSGIPVVKSPRALGAVLARLLLACLFEEPPINICDSGSMPN